MKRNILVVGCMIWTVAYIFFGCTENKINPEAKGHIKGQVIDDFSDDPITDAQLTTNPATQTFITNDTGYFFINNIDIGEYTLAIKKAGYRSESVTITVKEEDTTFMEVLMNRNAEFNKIPVISKNPTPPSGTINQPIDLKLSWNAYDPNQGDTLTYDLTIFTSGNPNSKTIYKDLTDTSLFIEDLEFNTTYFWQVSANDGITAVNSEIWSFKTRFFPNNPFIYVKSVNSSYEIFSGDSLPENTVQLTENSKNDWYPKLDPFGQRIAFATHYNLEPHIYTMDIYGKDLKRITNIPVTGYFNNGIGFCWSNYGNYIFFAHNNILYRVNKDGSGLSEIANAPKGRNFRIINASHDGHHLVTQTIGSKIYDSEIYLMQVNGLDTMRIVDNLPGIIDYPSFSVDDKKILFTHDISGNEAINGRQLNTHIFTIDIETKQLTDISTEKPDGTVDIQPSYSPDGSKIIFVNTSNSGTAPKNIWVMDTDGKNRKPLISEAEMPQWREPY